MAPIPKGDPRYDQILYLLGPWVIGCFLDFLFQGILFCQFVNYFTWYPKDKTFLKVIVAILVIMTTLKSIQCFFIVWMQNVIYFTDLEGALSLTYTTWWQSGNPLMVACIDAYVQVYFLYRLYAISRQIFVVLPVAIILLFAFIAQIMATYYITIPDGLKIQQWFAAHLSTVFAGDLLITAFSVYFLLKARKRSLNQTKHLVDQLIRICFQSAAPAAICAMLNLITSQVWDDERIISTIFNTSLPKLYAISMMYTLNTRHGLRLVSTTGASGSSGNQPSTRPRRTGPARENVELGALSGIQVHTEVERVEHVDMLRNMYTRHDSSGGDIKESPSPDNDSIHKPRAVI